MKGSHFERNPEDVRKSLEAGGGQQKVLRELKEARRRLGWSQAKLAREAFLHQTHVSAILNGGMVPKLSTFLDLVHAMDLEVVLVSKPLVPTVEKTVKEAVKKAGRGDVLAYRGDERPRYAGRGLADAAAGAESRLARTAGGDRPRYAGRVPEEG